jgi:glyoxylase-like metal-dependent hydrolase (beta-lactamase superfamily II)
MDNNVYLMTVKATGAQVLVDAADDPIAIGRLLAAAAKDTVQPHVDVIVTTHSHWDHIRALKALVADTKAQTVAGSADAAEIRRATGVVISRPVDDGDTTDVDGLSLGVIGLRGHTPGSITLVLRSPGQPVHLFTGDSLFPGGVGNTHQDPGRFTQLWTDVTERVFAHFADDTVVHPGHGRPTTLGVERPHLEEWRARGW